jgi:hypothetical protein
MSTVSSANYMDESLQQGWSWTSKKWRLTTRVAYGWNWWHKLTYNMDNPILCSWSLPHKWNYAWMKMNLINRITNIDEFDKMNDERYDVDEIQWH